MRIGNLKEPATSLVQDDSRYLYSGDCADYGPLYVTNAVLSIDYSDLDSL